MSKFCIAILLFFCLEGFAQTDPCKPAITITTPSTTICTGTTAVFSAVIAYNGTATGYVWKRNDQNETASNSAIYTFNSLNDGDLITCEYTCKTACGRDTTITSTAMKMTVPAAILPVVAVSNTDPLICEGEVTSFTAQATYGSAQPFYQWYVNDEVVGTNSMLYATNTLTNGSKVQCVLTITSSACPGFSDSASNYMTIYVYPMIHPAIQIKADKPNICKGETVTFSATANGGEYPLFAWELNGVRTGDSSKEFITSNLKDGDVVSCTVTVGIDSRCKSDTISAPSNPVVIHVKDFPMPGISIASPNLNVCEGEQVSFSATEQNAGFYKKYEWLVNGKKAGDNSAFFTGNQFKNGDTVSCRFSTDVFGCPFVFDVVSNTKKVAVRPKPVISFLPDDIVIKAGEHAQLNAIISGKAGLISWTPAALLADPHLASTATVPLYDDTSFSVLVIDTNGCSAAKTISVKILHQLYLPAAFTPNSDGLNDIFRIPEIATIKLIQFTILNRSGKIIFTTSNRSHGWDGTYNGQPLDPGNYVYVVKGFINKKETVFKGNVLLMR